MPLYLRSNDSPEKIGTYERRVVRDFCYIGYRYREDLVPGGFNGIYHRVTDHKKFLPYDTRKDIYLSSHFALGFQCGVNIKYELVTQRIFEGLAYGCIVLSESFPACQQTDNIVVLVKDKQDIEDKMRYYLDNPEEMKRKQQEGYDFVKKSGTNEYSFLS